MTGVARLYGRFLRDRGFWKRVDAAAPGECWPWSGPVDADGAPRYQGARADVHAYELAGGSVPADARLVHTCGNRLCMNPRHLALR